MPARGLVGCVTRRNAEVVEQALRFFEGQKYVLSGYVVMPNHVHVLGAADARPSAEGDSALVEVFYGA